MRKLNKNELLEVNGGQNFYETLKSFFVNNLEDLIQGIKDGWNRK